jgi:nuclear pore complex protein Nup205
MLLRTVLFVLDEARTLLDTYSPFPGKQKLEAASTAALELLVTGLRLSEDFIAAGRAAGAAMVLTSLAKLLLGLNPRTGSPDHMLNVTKFVHYGYWLPAAKLAAVKVIGHVAASPTNQPALLATLTATTEISNLTLKAFTDALDAEDEEDMEEGGVELVNRGPKLVPREPGATRLAILDLLRNGLNMASPSLAHFLLGFDLRRGVARTELQSPSVAGIRTPLHAVIDLLTPGEPGTPAVVISRAPHLATAMYHLIFMLVSNPETSETVLRFLRSGRDFFASQLACITAMLDQDGIQSLRSAAWLLRATAVELRMLARTRLVSQMSKLLGLLLDATSSGDNLEGGSEGGDGAATLATSGLYSDTTFSQLSRTMSQTSRYQNHSKMDSPLANHRLITILNCVSFQVEQMPPASWELFDDAQVAAVLEQCEVVLGSSTQAATSQERLILVPKLHRILAAELANLQGSAGVNQRSLIQSEIQSILLYAVRWNSIQEGVAARRDLLDAWRQVTEVLLVSAPADQLPAASKQQILLQLLQTLLNKAGV